MSNIHDEVQKAKRCAEIIKFQHEGEHSKYPNQQQARTEPNTRLKHVFGIDNAFTNADENKRSFVNKTQELMWQATKMRNHKDDGDWSLLADQSTAFCWEFLAVKSKSGVTRLSELVQYVVLKQSLCYLFEDAQEALGASVTQMEDIGYIAQRTNELWIQIKNSDHAETLAWEQEKKLHDTLLRVTTKPDVGGLADKTQTPDPTKPKRNPMNLLLPAYETMWRVVLRCVIEICFRNPGSGNDWAAIMKTYISALRPPGCKPNHAFHAETATGRGVVRPSDIVKEALRLYPPTRRVHRCFNGQQVAANIEECHRLNILGAPDPLVFRPERWAAICINERQAFHEQAALTEQDDTFLGYKKAKDDLRRAEEQLGYMPFAYFCAADHAMTKEFASKMIGMLVGVLCEALSGGWRLENAFCLPATGVPLDSDRAAYEDLELRCLK